MSRAGCGHDHEDAAAAAAHRAEEARTRALEIERRLRDLRAKSSAEADGEDRVRNAKHDADEAARHRAESSKRAECAHRRSADAHEAAAQAHDRAAVAHDRAAAACVGDIEEHQRLSRRHRAGAEADRAAHARELAHSGEGDQQSPADEDEQDV